MADHRCLYCNGTGCKHCFDNGLVGPVRHKLQCEDLGIEYIEDKKLGKCLEC